jgi:hypothetical protein
MIYKAILSLRPNSQWTLNGDSYQGLEWLDESQTKPTEAEIQAEIVRLQAEYKAKEYQRQRATAYPSIADQLDTLYHGGYDAWKATITAVKEEFPKP